LLYFNHADNNVSLIYLIVGIYTYPLHSNVHARDYRVLIDKHFIAN
jgi:hypothetical protein